VAANGVVAFVEDRPCGEQGFGRSEDVLHHPAIAGTGVMPSITGCAHVHGLRGEIADLLQARERVAYDLEYIDNWSIWLDLKILLMTIWVLLVPNNAYRSPVSATGSSGKLAMAIRGSIGLTSADVLRYGASPRQRAPFSW
jgi:hypothetical protein